MNSRLPANYAAAAKATSSVGEARARIATRIVAAAARYQWPPAMVPTGLQIIEATMAELPTVVQQTAQAMGLMAPALLAPLQALQAWLDEPFGSGEPAALADETLERAYAALRVLACIPGALSVQGVYNLLLIHDVIDAPAAARLDGAIVARFPGTILLPVAQLAMQLQQAQALNAAGATGMDGRYAHPLYGNVTTDEVVKLELGRYGIV